MKRYEGLFILRASAQDDRVKELIDSISAEIAASGGKVETTQKMDKRPFARVADKKDPAGFYVNFIFEAPPGTVGKLRHQFARKEDIFRVLFTQAAETPVPAKVPLAHGQLQ